MRVLHIISGLGVGGAEMLLYQQLASLRREQVESYVIALRGGPVAEKIAALGVPVEIIEFEKLFNAPMSLLRLTWRVRAIAPDLVQTWMYHGDLFGGIAVKLAQPLNPRIPVLWNVLMSKIDPAYIKFETRLVIRACALFSHMIPEVIIVNNEAARLNHVALGYSGKKFALIPSSFDPDKFLPDPVARAELRNSLGISPDALVVGIAGRIDPAKDFGNFFAAGREVCETKSQVVLMACGEGISMDNPQIQEWLEGIAPSQVRVLGRQSDMPRFWAAVDVGVSSSLSEGFSLAIGEAMSTGIPCAVTDVGDSSRVVGETGLTVPPQNSHALALAILTLLDMRPESRQQLGALARQRVIDNYSLTIVTNAFLKLWQDVLSKRKMTYKG